MVPRAQPGGESPRRRDVQSARRPDPQPPTAELARRGHGLLLRHEHRIRQADGLGVHQPAHAVDDARDPAGDLGVALRGRGRGRGRQGLGDGGVVTVVAQGVCHAHQRAAGADTGDEAVEATADLPDQLGSGRVPVGEDVPGVLELPRCEQAGLRACVGQQCGDGPAHTLLGRREHDVATEPADHQDPLTADRLGHVRPEPHAHRGAHHAQGDRRRPARRLDDDGGRSHLTRRDRVRDDARRHPVLGAPAGQEVVELQPEGAAGLLVVIRDGRGLEGQPQQPRRPLDEPGPDCPHPGLLSAHDPRSPTRPSGLSQVTLTVPGREAEVVYRGEGRPFRRSEVRPRPTHRHTEKRS